MSARQGDDVGVLISRWVAKWLEKALLHLEMEPPIRELLTRIGRAAVLALFVIMALQNLGVELLPIIAGLGVAGAGLALAMQGLFGNVIAGLTIILTKPFRVAFPFHCHSAKSECLLRTRFDQSVFKR